MGNNNFFGSGNRSCAYDKNRRCNGDCVAFRVDTLPSFSILKEEIKITCKRGSFIIACFEKDKK